MFSLHWHRSTALRGYLRFYMPTRFAPRRASNGRSQSRSSRPRPTCS
jgi:hypothetical protein